MIGFLGEMAISKRRVGKGYRIEELDRRLRKERTRKEVRLLSLAKNLGVLTPYIYFLMLEEGTLIMEYVRGPRLKDIFDAAVEDNEGWKTLISASLEKIGRDVGRLHAGGITHGDLTTSNMLLYREGAEELHSAARSGELIEPDEISIYYIDLSLGEKDASLEKLGEDLDVFFKAFESTHPSLLPYLEDFWGGYASVYQEYAEVRQRCAQIRKRARYR